MHDQVEYYSLWLNELGPKWSSTWAYVERSLLDWMLAAGL